MFVVKCCKVIQFKDIVGVWITRNGNRYSRILGASGRGPKSCLACQHKVEGWFNPKRQLIPLRQALLAAFRCTAGELVVKYGRPEVGL